MIPADDDGSNRDLFEGSIAGLRCARARGDGPGRDVARDRRPHRRRPQPQLAHRRSAAVDGPRGPRQGDHGRQRAALALVPEIGVPTPRRRCPATSRPTSPSGAGFTGPDGVPPVVAAGDLRIPAEKEFGVRRERAQQRWFRASSPAPCRGTPPRTARTGHDCAEHAPIDEHGRAAEGIDADIVGGRLPIGRNPGAHARRSRWPTSATCGPTTT